MNSSLHLLNACQEPSCRALCFPYIFSLKKTTFKTLFPSPSSCSQRQPLIGILYFHSTLFFSPSMFTNNTLFPGLPGGASGKASACQCRRYERRGFNSWVRKIPWRRARQPTPVFFPGESHGQRSLVGYSP